MIHTRSRRACRILLPLVAAAIALTATPAMAHDYQYWYARSQSKIFMSTTPGSALIGRASASKNTTMTLTAARGEYESRQIVIRPTAGPIEDVWLEPSDLVTEDGSSTIDAANVEVFKVDYVKVSIPSRGFRRKGYFPDPLIPMKLVNGERLGWKPFGQQPTTAFRTVTNLRTQSFFVTIHVPNGTAAGIYRGTIRITARGVSDGEDLPEVVVPVQIEVYPFSIEKRTLKTSFGLSNNYAMYAGSANHKWLRQGSGEDRITERTDFSGDQMLGWYRYMQEHRVSPQNLSPGFDSNGAQMQARNSYLSDYLDTGAASTHDGDRLAFNTAQMPQFLRPDYVKNPFASTTRRRNATTYYRSMRSSLYPWLSKTYAYPVDEPLASQRSFVERYASFIHQVAPGVKFLLTTDPVTMRYRPLKGVDVYVHRLHFFYRDKSRWITPLRNKGKKVWIYTHAGAYQAQTPSYLIDGPLTDPRAQGWFAYHSYADGLLYFNVAAWRPKQGVSTYRNPYADPLSARPGWANGEGSLTYPGYYPAKGLYIQGSPPVGSLRMESLRDGLEDYEYLKLVQAKKGRTYALLAYTKRVIGPPRTVISAQRKTFPAYPKYQTTYDTVRRDMANKLKQYY